MISFNLKQDVFLPPKLIFCTMAGGFSRAISYRDFELRSEKENREESRVYSKNDFVKIYNFPLLKAGRRFSLSLKSSNHPCL